MQRPLRSGDQMKVNDFVSNLWGLAISPGPSRKWLITDKSETFKSKAGKMNYQNYIDSPGRGLRSRTFPRLPSEILQTVERGWTEA
jgi:hypothetical protein